MAFHPLELGRPLSRQRAHHPRIGLFAGFLGQHPVRDGGRHAQDRQLPAEAEGPAAARAPGLDEVPGVGLVVDQPGRLRPLDGPVRRRGRMAPHDEPAGQVAPGEGTAAEARQRRAVRAFGVGRAAELVIEPGSSTVPRPILQPAAEPRRGP